MAPLRANGSRYDVFLSFRGEDTRYGFTDHLNEALKLAGTLTFRDSDDAERGEKLKSEIEKEIKSSDASIIVLSANYAISTWCLDELSLILDQRRDCNHFVLPVFYHVDPSDVGNHRGSFMIEVKPSERWTEDNVNKWKAALTEVSSVIGMPVDGYNTFNIAFLFCRIISFVCYMPETKFIKEVVNKVYNRLDRKQFFIPPNLTGMDARYKEILNCWLTTQSSEAEILIINGMPGSGKSTLAQYIVYTYGQHYESSSIVENIGGRCENSRETVKLQQQLCSDISRGKHRKIHTVCQGTAEIEMLLAMTKVLVVLDDIVEEHQLDDFIGYGNINKESKIIITTKVDTSSWFMSTYRRFQEYKMKLLSDDESLELFSLHAFRSKRPKDGYQELAQQVVQYCDGNPLALRVLGSSLSQKNSVALWESELSLDLLPDLERELLLHIACFFVAEDVDYVVKILEPDYSAKSRIETLIKRSFLYVTSENKIMMHRLLQTMGRTFVDRESSTVAKRSRVWRNKDSYNMIRRKESSRTVGLALDIQMLMKENGFGTRELKELDYPTHSSGFHGSICFQIYMLDNRSRRDDLLGFQMLFNGNQMDELKLLKLGFVKFNGLYEDISVHLRWLCWVGFSESMIHTEIFMGNMVALDLSYSCLKEFEPPTVLHTLKILNLKESHSLLKIHNIHQIPNLENLILKNCRNLFHICGAIGNLEKLAVLNMTGCLKLNKMEQERQRRKMDLTLTSFELLKNVPND
ncbi:disease resistance protein RUN1-like [Rutidosis leptorrhynchoides]|uniref:disease resistance protein RUN1-like n=1 Tax=Rutidosis leptorrhynchoides TaxID=125765 RepID=UPI003A99551E